jgi:uncharacterized membrane protein YraQ (UPF0718 family)
VTSTLVLWAIAAALGLLVLRRGRGVLVRAVGDGARRFLVILPRMGVAILLAGFVAAMIPGEPVAAALGPESGLVGILFASVAGGFVPSGPIVSFPLVVVLWKAGAGLPQLVAFLTAWSVFAFHRVLIYESTLMGWRFVALRLVASLVLPVLAGVLALGLERLLDVPVPR